MRFPSGFRPRGLVYEHMVLFAAFGVVWSLVAPRVSGNPWGLLAGQAAGLALTMFVCQGMFPEGTRRPRAVALGVYLALATLSTACALQAHGLPETLQDPESARLMGLLGPVVQPIAAFAAGKRAIPDPERD